MTLANHPGTFGSLVKENELALLDCEDEFHPFLVLVPPIRLTVMARIRLSRRRQ